MIDLAKVADLVSCFVFVFLNSKLLLMKCVRKQISEAEVCDGDMLCEAAQLEFRYENEDLCHIGPLYTRRSTRVSNEMVFCSVF